MARHRLLRKQTLIVLLAIWAGINVLGLIGRWYCERRASSEAQDWLQEASRYADASLTREEAIRWLLIHDFHTVGKGEAKTEHLGQPPEYHLIATGIRRTQPCGRFKAPVWVIITFYFDTDEKFVRVGHEVWDHDPGN